MKYSHSLLLLTIYCLCLFPTACSSAPTQNQTISSTSRATSTTTANPTTTSLPTNCPQTGTGRAATMPPLTQPVGHHQNIVYINEEDNAANEPISGELIRYDVTSSRKTTILKRKNASIQEAQLSSDGQWILFTNQIYNPAKHYFGTQMLQLVRIDGQGLQTLYCAPQSTGLLMLTWSPDQQHVAFFGGKKEGDSFAGVSTIDMRTGKVQLVLDDPSALDMLFWKNNQQLYIRFAFIVPTNTLYLLDTTHGSNQHKKDLTSVFQQQTSKPCWNAAASVDGTALFISQCTPAPPARTGAPYVTGPPSSISKQAATGGSLHTILTTKQLAIVDVHTVSQHVLLFEVDKFGFSKSETDSRNGLWKVNTDGSGLLQLTHEVEVGDGNEGPAWRYASRDGTYYAYGIWDQTTKRTTLKYGSLSGGPTTSFTNSNSGSRIVGWTVM